jgi:sugar phosphate isomerase/epimerase
MKYALSSIMFPPKELDLAIDYANELGVELEIFPMWHTEAFCHFMKRRRDDLRSLASSFHEPYHFSDHSFERGTKEHDQTMALCRKTFEIAADIGAKNIVFHHNNRPIAEAEKADMRKWSAENLHVMNEIAAEYGIPYLVENAGVLQKGNVLFDQEEFIALFDVIPNNCLIDLGHAHCNGWDIPRVITALKGKIVAYHLHDNDKTSDSHQRLGEGTLDIAQFGSLFAAHTPNAQIILEYVEGTKATASDLKRELELLKGVGV